MSNNETVIVVGKKYHARCDYCGSTEGTDWKKAEFKIYCSSDCKRAGDIPVWLCVLIVFSSFAVSAWTTFGTTSFEFLGCVLFTISSLVVVIRGIQARNRVAQR